MARIASKLRSLGPAVLMLGLPVLIGGATLAWILRAQQPTTLALSESLVQELLDQQAPGAAIASEDSRSEVTLAIPPLGAQPELAIRVMLHNAPGLVSVESGERTETLGCQERSTDGGLSSMGAQRWFQSAPGRSIGLISSGIAVISSCSARATG